MDKWGERKDSRHLLATLNTAKINENETVEEFNKRFNQIVSSLHADVKPPPAVVLIHYVDDFSGDLAFHHLRQRDSNNINEAQEETIKIERNMTTFGKSNLPGFSRASTSRAEPKASAINTANPAPDPLIVITKGIKK